MTLMVTDIRENVSMASRDSQCLWKADYSIINYGVNEQTYGIFHALIDGMNTGNTQN